MGDIISSVNGISLEGSTTMPKSQGKATERFTDLGKLNFSMVVWFYSTAPAASKNDAWFKRGQNLLKNKQLALLI